MRAGRVFTCQQCGNQSGKWLGRCPGCDGWGTLVEGAPPAAAAGDDPLPAVPPIPYPEIGAEAQRRIETGIGEFDRVLGGGLVPGAVILVGGEPGIGKSTLVLQAASALADAGRRVLYVTGEESAGQLRGRGERLGVRSAELRVAAETDVAAVLRSVAGERPALVVIDSIQALRCAELGAVPGSVTQVRESASRLVRVAKQSAIPMLIVGHVTKDGSLAGPRTLEHVVDTVIQFDGDRHHEHRVLRALKNRFGPTDELGVFRMREFGLEQVPNPSELFLAERPVGAPGSAVLAAVQGTRPLLLEVQALVGEAAQGSPRRTALGVDANRMALVLAVVQRRTGFDLAGRDVFVNVTGGASATEPAADLAVAAALVSSLLRRPLPAHAVFAGEIGLTGEVRGISRVDARLREAARLGFRVALGPWADGTRAPAGLRLAPIRRLEQALREALGAAIKSDTCPRGDRASGSAAATDA